MKRRTDVQPHPVNHTGPIVVLVSFSFKLKHLSLSPLFCFALFVRVCFYFFSSTALRANDCHAISLSRPCWCLVAYSYQVAVGEVVRAANGDHLPADLVILSSRSGKPAATEQRWERSGAVWMEFYDQKIFPHQ